MLFLTRKKLREARRSIRKAQSFECVTEEAAGGQTFARVALVAVMVQGRPWEPRARSCKLPMGMKEVETFRWWVGRFGSH